MPPEATLPRLTMARDWNRQELHGIKPIRWSEDDNHWEEVANDEHLAHLVFVVKGLKKSFRNRYEAERLEENMRGSEALKRSMAAIGSPRRLTEVLSPMQHMDDTSYIRVLEAMSWNDVMRFYALTASSYACALTAIPTCEVEVTAMKTVVQLTVPELVSIKAFEEALARSLMEDIRDAVHARICCVDHHDKLVREDPVGIMEPLRKALATYASERRSTNKKAKAYATIRVTEHFMFNRVWRMPSVKEGCRGIKASEHLAFLVANGYIGHKQAAAVSER
jgi:hypothetical protein